MDEDKKKYYTKVKDEIIFDQDRYIKDKIKELKIPKGVITIHKGGGITLKLDGNKKNHRETVKKLQSIGLLQKGAKERGKEQGPFEEIEEIGELFEEEISDDEFKELIGETKQKGDV